MQERMRFAQLDAARWSHVPSPWAWFFCSCAAVVLFAAWTVMAPHSLGPASIEDGPVEVTSAVLYFIGGFGFIVAAIRSDYLLGRNDRWAYLFMMLWAALCLVCAGEEISWGQRILGFETPEKIAAANLQGEFTLHNLEAFNALGGTYRYLSIFTLGTGLLIPAFASTAWGLRLTRMIAFPVAPWALMPAFVGAYVYGAYFIEVAPIADIKPANTINEVREFLIGYAMALYGLLAALTPNILFRLPPTKRTV